MLQKYLALHFSGKIIVSGSKASSITKKCQEQNSVFVNCWEEQKYKESHYLRNSRMLTL